jgi:hypothetical protein
MLKRLVGLLTFSAIFALESSLPWAHATAVSPTEGNTGTSVTQGTEPTPAPSASPIPGARPLPLAPAPTQAAAATREAPEDSAIYVADPRLHHVAGLAILNPGPRVLIVSKAGTISYTATIEGRFKVPESSLLWKGRIIEQQPDGRFSLTIQVTAPSMKLELDAISSLGQIDKEKIVIHFPHWEAFKRDAADKPPKSRFFSVGGGLSMIAVSDSRVEKFTELGLTLKGSYAQPLFAPNWDMGVSTYFTALPFGANRSDSIRFLGVNLRVGYVIPKIREPWRVSLQGGLYYTTMFVQSASFGFQNMAGPQLFPTIRRVFRKGDAVSGYFKFSPVSSDFSFDSPENHEIAAGIAYSRPVFNGKSLGISFDASSLHVLVEAVEIGTITYTLGLSYGF